MVQFFIVLLVPPAVGLITYFLIRFPWKRGAQAISIGQPRRRSLPRFSIFAAPEKQLRSVEPGRIQNPRRRAISLLVFGVVGGFVFGWYFF
jgi:hypothetical protein